MTVRLALLLLAAAVAAGAADPPAAAPPAPVSDEDRVVPDGPLPRDVRPRAYRLQLDVDPAADRFAGRARIDLDLDRPRANLWLHGADLAVRSAAVETPRGLVPARWEQVDPTGVAELSLARPVGPGRVRLRIAWDAPVDRQLRGLYRVEADGTPYLFTQMEPILARRVFPGFDEPRFKTPFDVALVVAPGVVAIGNAPVVDTTPLADGTRVRVRFARTPPLPTYLLAVAVGTLDVVEGPPLAASPTRPEAVALRGVTVRGRGTRLRRTLDESVPLFAALEHYFGIAYPFAKLDFLAVPDMAWGGMENAGAITFRESLLFVGPDAPEAQRRSSANVVAHEVSHQWFGDLVTMPWWDDIWLNEAFATWIASKVVEQVRPEFGDALYLVTKVQEAMDTDSLASARRIRQPIASTHDIVNAFDGITYSKGAGVLAMIERWIGPEAMRRGLGRYLAAHRFGSATADDLLAALSTAAARDVTALGASFLDQPGVPLVDVRPMCQGGRAWLALAQSRYAPVGSTIERAARWQVPVCARWSTGDRIDEGCTVLTEARGTLDVGTSCPVWVLPNAAAAGYYRWTLPPPDLVRLRTAGWQALTPAERLGIADALDAAFAAAALPAADVLVALTPFAADPSRPVAEAPMALARFTREQVVDDATRPAVERWIRELYAPRLATLGWDPVAGENGDAKLLRAAVIELLAQQGGDAAVRREAAERGRRVVGNAGDGALDETAVAPEAIEAVLAVAVQDGDADFFDGLVRELRATNDDLTRRRLLTALGSASAPALAARARALALGPDVRIGETVRILWSQSGQPETRAATWTWIQESFDPLVAHLSERAQGELPWLASGFCDPAHADELATFFQGRIERLPGGPRNLAGAVEAIRLCAARVAAQRASAGVFFGG